MENPNPPPPPQSFIDRIETVMDALGLMRGRYAIFKRALFGAAIFSIAMVIIKPSFAFYRGMARPWKALDDGSDLPATWVPWWSGSLFGAALFGLFI